MLPKGSCQTPITKSMYSFQKRTLGSGLLVMLLLALAQV